MLEQHDNHCWLTWDGENYFITRINQHMFYLDNGVMYCVIMWLPKNYPAYADKAAKLLEKQ